MIQRSLAFILLIFFPLLATVSLAQERSIHADRETQKLKPLGVEQLSAQDLTDIYTACIADNLSRPDVGSEARMNLDNLRRSCQLERKNLALKLPQKSINELDSIFVARFNEIAGGKDTAPEPGQE